MRDAQHPPLDRARHAEVVAELVHHNPKLWRLLFRAPRYAYDQRDRFESITVDNDMQELRIRFMLEKDWDSMTEILARLARLDRRACRMSIGIYRDDGSVLLGESIG